MKIAEWRAKTDAELREEFVRKQEEMSRLKFQRAVEQLEDPSVVGRARKDLARILTILRERKLVRAPGGESGGAKGS